jgi:chromosome segregation ATPase
MSNESSVSDLTLEVLKDIRGELRQLRGDVDGLRSELRSELRGVRGELVDLRGELGEVREELRDVRGELREVRGELITLNQRVDGALKIAGTHHGELESRVRRIEDHLGLT